MKDLPAFILSIALIRCLIKLLFLFLEKKSTVSTRYRVITREDQN